MSAEVKQASNSLRKFMFSRVYLDDKVKQEADKAERIIYELYSHYLKNPDLIPENFRHYALHYYPPGRYGRYDSQPADSSRLEWRKNKDALYDAKKHEALGAVCRHPGRVATDRWKFPGSNRILCRTPERNG